MVQRQLGENPQAKFARELREIMAELRDAETNLRNLELLEGLKL